MANKRIYFLCVFVVALIATSGSLYFSEVMYFQPCKLCWYQRILMYPQILIALVGIISASRSVVFINLLMSVLGFFIAAFHVGLQNKLFGLNESSCSDSLCSMEYVNYFGFITIPVMSLTAFSIILLLTFGLLYKRR